MTIETVLGPVDELPGVVDAHAHVWIDAVEGTDPVTTFLLNDERGIVAGLRSFKSAGGGAAIDCMPGSAGRNLGLLARISDETGVAIVASTGFHLPEYYADDEPRNPWTGSPEAALERFERELGVGVPVRGRERPVRVGAIKTAHVGDRDEPRFEPLFEAAIAAAKSTGAALMVHTERGANVEAVVEIVGAQGLDPRRVVLCHVDKRPDAGLHLELASAGFLLEYDTFLRPKYGPEEHLWPLLERMLAAGAEDAVACALDLADPLQWRFGGALEGPDYLAWGVAVRLAAAGVDRGAIDQITGRNIERRLRKAGAP